MKRNKVGVYDSVVAGGDIVKAFTPAPLPPEPKLEFDYSLMQSATKAHYALGALNGLSRLPDLDLFLYQYVRKEAVLSSQIEGTQSTLDDLLLYEDGDTPGVPFDDVIEVSNYLRALNHGMNRLFSDNFPLSTRLIKEMHAELLDHGRGSDKMPGEFKRSQNWLGGVRPKDAVFVPTPPQQTLQAMGDLESFINGEAQELPALIVAGLAHVQFETIHPFLDGNGRLGRMLITLILCERGLLDKPSLYLSLYFKAHRGEYYQKLQSVRKDGDWEGWLKFYLDGVTTTAMNAVETAEKMRNVFLADRELLQNAGLSSSGVVKTHEHMFGRISTNIKSIAEKTKLTIPTVSSALQKMEDLGVLEETTGRQRGKRYLYSSVYKALASDLGDFDNDEESRPDDLDM